MNCLNIPRNQGWLAPSLPEIRRQLSSGVRTEGALRVASRESQGVKNLPRRSRDRIHLRVESANIAAVTAHTLYMFTAGLFSHSSSTTTGRLGYAPVIGCRPYLRDPQAVYEPGAASSAHAHETRAHGSGTSSRSAATGGAPEGAPQGRRRWRGGNRDAPTDRKTLRTGLRRRANRSPEAERG